MENNEDRHNLDSYIAKYMDEHGCSLESACSMLEININNVFTRQNNEFE